MFYSHDEGSLSCRGLQNKVRQNKDRVLYVLDFFYLNVSEWPRWKMRMTWDEVVYSLFRSLFVFVEWWQCQISFWFPFSWSWPSSDDEPSLKAGYDLHYNDNITHEYPGEDMDMVDKDMIWLHHNDNIIHEYHGEDMDMVDMDITIKT